MPKKVSKKIGSQERAERARVVLTEIFSNINHPSYLEKDIDLAKKLEISRLTLYTIREELRVPPRTDRILHRLRSMNTKEYTKKELAALLGLKYQNLYKILNQYTIPVKTDTPPIHALIRHQKEKASKRLEA